jgi:hypothetical protein
VANPDSFLKFAQVILPPPWSAAVALVLVLGLVWLGAQLARRLRAALTPSPLDVAAGFVLATALVAALVHALALFGAATPAVLRAIGGALAASGLGMLSPASRAHARRSFETLQSMFRDATRLQRWALLASCVTVLSLGLASLGPPTDSDTLSYHLSVPLDWLAHGGARPRPEWLHARLVGLGESLNLLGLAMGTDCLGSLFQAAGLFVAVVAVASVAPTKSDRVFAVAIVTSCPLLPLMTLTSKPQLLPAAVCSVALALLVFHRSTSFKHFNIGTLWLIFGGLGFAVACKHSFIPGGVAITILVLTSLRRTPWFARALLVALSSFVVFALPVFVRNVLFYGDPLSPVFEGLRQNADPVITTFSSYLRDFGGDHSPANLLRLPWSLVVATRPWQLTSVLGAGALAVFAAIGGKKGDRDILAAAGAVTLATLVFGQLQARFFFESYLWCALAAVLASWTLRKHVLMVVLSLQMIETTAVAVYSLVAFLPAALTTGQREQLMTRTAPDYALSTWLDATLPQDAVVASDRVASLLMPRLTIPVDLAQMVAMAPLPEAAKQRRLRAALSIGGANTLLVTIPAYSSPYESLATELGAPTHVSPDFADAARNPWKQGPPYRVMIYSLRPEAVP